MQIYFSFSRSLEELRRLKEADTDEAGGWWCNGLDPFNGWQPMLWGQFKGDTPRQQLEVSKDGKPLKVKTVKYEPPPKQATRAYFLAVPNHIAEQVYQQASVTPTEQQLALGFWYCVWFYDIPIIVTEGAKKAGERWICCDRAAWYQQWLQNLQRRTGEDPA